MIGYLLAIQSLTRGTTVDPGRVARALRPCVRVGSTLASW